MNEKIVKALGSVAAVAAIVMYVLHYFLFAHSFRIINCITLFSANSAFLKIYYVFFVDNSHRNALS